MTVFAILMLTWASVLGLAALVGVIVYITWRRLLIGVESQMGHAPAHSLWEILFTLKSHSLSALLLTMQRAESGQSATHPISSAPTIDWLSQIGFDPATFTPAPLDDDEPIDLAVTLGPKSSHPLKIALPVMIAPMGYGIGLSAEAKVALAQAASLAGTAVFSGEGPYLPEERAYAERFILQQSRGNWAHQANVLHLADMIELQWGQGSEGGMAVLKRMDQLPQRTIRAAHGPVTIAAAPFATLRQWVEKTKRVRDDCPLSIKIPATQHLEQDLACLLTLPIDVITLDASGAGSAGSPSVISDHSGIAAAPAVYRAHQWLLSAAKRAEVSLIISGGIHGAADTARLIALGADAVLVGSSVLFAALHEQVAKHLPTPPTELLFARSQHNRAARLDINQSSEKVVNWFDATHNELETILRTLGHASLSAFRDAAPLIARTEAASRLFHIPFDGCVVTLDQTLLDGLTRLTDSYHTLNTVLKRIEKSGWPPPTTKVRT